MALIKVNTGKLEEGAQKIEQLKKELETEIAALKSNAVRLFSYWEGESKQAFVNSVNQNANLLTTFANNTQNFADALRTASSTHAEKEGKAIQIFTNKGQG